MSEPALVSLYERIAARCREIGARVPCRPGCDSCCRRLAQPPQLTGAEWEHLRQQLALLSPDCLLEVRQRVDELRAQAQAPEPPRHFVCPLLDREGGRCLTYLGRPAACRTYGYYLTRGQGLFCERMVELQSGESDVIWGNHDAVEAELVRLFGEQRTLPEWFEQWQGRGSPR